MSLKAAIALTLMCSLLPAQSLTGVTMIGVQINPAGQLLALSANGKYLVSPRSGRPVFLLGEAAFDVAVQIPSAAMQTYFATRAAQGYTGIWIAAVDNAYQNNAPQNNAGNVPFSGGDFVGMSGQTAYWNYLDTVIATAAQYGMVVFLNAAFVGLTSTGGYVASIGSASCPTLTSYGSFLGARYASATNIVWLVGGDWDPTGLVTLTKLQCIAAGIRSQDAVHLLTVEVCRACTPANQSSMDGWSSGTPTIDLNWVYAPLASIQASCASNYSRSGALPALDGEDWYEGEHSMTDLQLREESYWAVLSGCTLGRLFGNNPIWCFNSTNPSSGGCNSSPTYAASYTSDGSLYWMQSGKLFRSREFWLMAPDLSNTVLTGGIGSGITLSVAACSSDGVTCNFYDPTGNSQPLQVNMAHWSGPVHGWWFNPSNGATTDLGTFTNTGTHTFTPPDGNDWVLVLDLNSAGLAAPGTGSFQ